MLVLEDLTVAMGDGTLQADLCAEAGARIAVLGPSGAGKSTLLDAVAGFRAARSGRILWQGRALTTEPPDRRPVSILFQDGNLFPHLTVARNLGLALDRPAADPGQRHRPGSRGARGGRVGRLRRRARRAVGRAAGPRGAGARAAAGAAVLLLDEPFAALGPALEGRDAGAGGPRCGCAGALSLMVTHDPADARAFAQRSSSSTGWPSRPRDRRPAGRSARCAARLSRRPAARGR